MFRQRAPNQRPSNNAHLRRPYQYAQVQRSLCALHTRRHDGDGSIHHTTNPHTSYCPADDEYHRRRSDSTYQ